MMQSRSIARELALLVLGQIPEKHTLDSNSFSLDSLLHQAINSLTQHWREGLDTSANQLEIAQQHFLDSELQESEKGSLSKVRMHLKTSISKVEAVLNSVSAGLDLSRLLAFSENEGIRASAVQRVNLVLKQRQSIDERLDGVMEGWRLHRLPRIDRDILRLAVVDLIDLDTPAPVAFNEAVDLANRYSDEQGRRMINGVLRRLQNSLIARVS